MLVYFSSLFQGYQARQNRLGVQPQLGHVFAIQSDVGCIISQNRLEFSVA